MWDQLLRAPVVPYADRKERKAKPRSCKGKAAPAAKLPPVGATKDAFNPWGLTPQQLRAAALVSHGATPQTAAKAMDISIKTMYCHLERARVRMGVDSTNALIVMWCQANMLREAEGHRQNVNEQLATKLEAK